MGTPIIVTGAAGFIGMHTAERLLDRGETVIGGLLDNPPPLGSHEVYTIGDSQPARLMEMISTPEDALGAKAQKIMRTMQPRDVTATYADISKLNALTGYKPKVPLKDGLQQFVKWWRGYGNG